METLKTIVCSTAHFAHTDNQLLEVLANDYNDTGSGNDIFSFYGGYIIRLYAVSHPVLDLKKMGISKALRKFIVAMMKNECADIVIFDMDADYIEGFEIFDW